MALTVVTAFASASDSTSHVISLSGKSTARDLLVLFGSGATPTLPTDWVEQGTHTGAGSSYVFKFWRLPANKNTAGVTSLTIALSGSRALSAVVWEDDYDATAPNLYFTVFDNAPTADVTALWGTGLHTFATHDVAAAFFYGQSATGTLSSSGFDLVSYDNSYTQLGDSGVGLATNESRVWVASRTSTSMANDGVTATANGTRPTSLVGMSGMLAYDEGAPLSPDPVLGVVPTSLSFTYRIGDPAPGTQTVAINNDGGGGTVNWTRADDASWLSASPGSGTAPSTLTVTADPTGLNVGTYTGTITVTATGVTGSPQTVTVGLTIQAQVLTSVSTDVVRRYRQQGGAWRQMIEVPEGCTTPEAHGARGDCVLLPDAAMTTGQPDLTSASGSFAGSDVGKWVTVPGAGLTSQGSSLTAQIVSVPSSTHAVLSVNAASTVSAVNATYGTDDTQAWVQALAALVTDGVANGTYAGKLLVPPRQYMIAAATTKGGGTLGNSQIPIPYVNSLDQKFALTIQGTVDGSGFYHWRQKKPAASGSTLRTVLLGQTIDGTWGAPSVIGGPTRTTVEADSTAFFSNMLVHIDGLSVIAPRFPSLLGIDLGRIGQANIGTVSVNADALVGATSGLNLTVPNNDLGMALRMPAFQNNDNTNIFSYACEGFFYGIQISDHTTAQRLALIYCDTAIYCSPGGGPEHGAHLGYVSCEACNTGIECAGGAGGKYPVVINRFDVEVAGGGFTIKDDNDALTGEIHYAHNSSSAPSIKPKAGGTPGAQNVKIIDDNRYRGSVTAPSIPASATDFYNPFFRDAAVYVTGGTVSQVQVAGVTVPGTSGVFIVPSGKQVRLTYTVAPSWTWTLF